MSADIYALARIPIKHRCEGYYLRWYYNGWHYWHFIPGQIQYETQGENYRTTGTRKLSMGTGQITYEQCAAIKTIRNCRELYILTDYGWWNCIRIEPGSVTVYDHSVNGYEIELTAIIGGRAISITGYSPVAVVPVIPPDFPITYCEVDIPVANQTWMCKAWDSAFPNSKVYDNDEANRAESGGLYNWNQINSPGFVPPGWHVPTLGDWLTLFNAIGSITDAGGKLKEVGFTHWNAPNQDAVDTYGFAARSTGELVNNILFSGLLQTGTFWSTDESDADYPPTMGIAVQFSWQYGSVTLVDLLKTTFAGVRLIKNIPNPLPLRMILASFGGGTSPYSGLFSSYDDGLTWTISKSFGEGWEAGAWFAYNALTTQGGAHYFVGQPFEGGCCVYDIDNDVLWLKNDSNGAGTSVVEDFTADRLLVSTYKGAQYGKGFRFNVVTEQWDNIANINQNIFQVIAIDPDIIIYTTYGGIYCFNYAPSLRQAGQFTSMIKTVDGNLYAGDENGNVWESVDNGSTWSDMGNKTPASAILVMCLIGAGRILFYDYNDLWITDDQFVNVTKVKDGGAYGALLKVTETICLAFNADAGVSAGVYRSTDNGSTWQTIVIDPAFGGFIFGAIKIDL